MHQHWCVSLLEFLISLFSPPVHCCAKCEGSSHLNLLSAVGDEMKIHQNIYGSGAQ